MLVYDKDLTTFFYWDGPNLQWVQVGSGTGDNWGTQVVQTTGANITGDGTIANPIAVTDNDSDPTNEHNTNASLTGTILNITDGGGTKTVDLVNLNNETSGTYLATVKMFPAGAYPINSGGATLTFQARGKYVKQGSLVYITIDSLPNNITCNACTFYSISLPFPAIEKSNFSMGHARGMVWRYNAISSPYFLVEPLVNMLNPNLIIMYSSQTSTHYSGYIGLRNQGGTNQGTFIRSISGVYLASP